MLHETEASTLVSETLFSRSYNSPLGTYVLVSSKRGVVCVAPEEERNVYLARWERDGVHVWGASDSNGIVVEQLDAYFAGGLRQFSVPLDLRGTPFQLEVWELIRRIPYGESRSYRQLAQSLGHINYARAVGRAAGSNPVAIIVPCHRVVGANGSLTGYAGGLHRKRALLELESAGLN